MERLTSRIARMLPRILLGGWVVGVAAFAQPAPDDLAKTAEAALRNAQNLMFGGKREDAAAALVEAHRSVRQLRETAADDRRLAGLEGRIARLKGDLEKRLSKTLDLDSGEIVDRQAPAVSGAPPPPPRPTPPPLPGKPETAPGAVPPAPPRLHREVDQALTAADREFDALNGPYGRMDYYVERRDFEQLAKILNRIDEVVGADIPELLAEADKVAAKHEAQNHPRFAELRGRLQVERTRAAETRQRIERLQAETGAAAGAAGAEVDKLAAAYERLDLEYFERALQPCDVSGDLEPAAALVANIERFEKTELAGAQTLLAEFAARYGDNRGDIEKAIATQGHDGKRNPGRIYEEFARQINAVPKLRKDMSAALVREAEETVEGLPRAHDFFRLERHGRVRQLAEMATRFQPGDADLRQFVAGIPKRLDDDRRAYDARIDGRRWPGSIAGKRAEEEAGLKYFREDPDWGARPKDKEPRVIVAVAITGDWVVQKHDALRRPIMYGVPALVAVEVPAEKTAQKVLRAYGVTLRTAEGANAEAKPPFREISVGESYYVRPAAIKR